jgi:hypothetical protein
LLIDDSLIRRYVEDYSRHDRSLPGHYAYVACRIL